MPIAYPYKMSDWYGYDKDCVTLTSFLCSAQSNFSGVCTSTINQTKYHTGSGFLPTTGDTVWNNSNGTGVPTNGYYRVSLTSFIQITTGVSGSETAC